ncbi:MAG: hypothetical protein RLZZ107_355, partial [Bacteroidota bacterium]
MKHNYSITFACYNQVDYTKMCIDSLVEAGTPLERVVAVDNASSDNTLSYLSDLGLGGVIANKSNLGCGTAWNQGILAQQAEWTVVMNNDIVVSSNWIDQLIDAAIEHKLDIASPAMVEGKLNYNFHELARDKGMSMKHVARHGWAHAVCMLIHERVWSEIGYFRATPKLLGYEDTLFFHEAK